MGKLCSQFDRPEETHVVYPPCDTLTLEQLSLQPRRKEILSVAQFRPEKNHALQLEAFRCLLDEHPEHEGKVKLVLLGKLLSSLHLKADSLLNFAGKGGGGGGSSGRSVEMLRLWVEVSKAGKTRPQHVAVCVFFVDTLPRWQSVEISLPTLLTHKLGIGDIITFSRLLPQRR